MWARRFGSDPRIIGRSITINGATYQVVGVLPRGFVLPQEVLPLLYGTDQADIFVPLPLAAGAATVRSNEDYNIVARLKPGVSVQQARAEMATITARLRHDHPEVYPPNGGLTFNIVPLLEQVVGNVRYTLFVLLGGRGLRAADCLRERRQPFALARRWTAKRNRRAHRGRRQLWPHHSPVADGKRLARGVRRSFGCAVCHLQHALDPRSRPPERSPAR